jgi:hypothetical protein
MIHCLADYSHYNIPKENARLKLLSEVISDGIKIRSCFQMKIHVSCYYNLFLYF